MSKSKDKKRVELDNRTSVTTPFAKNYDYGEPGLGTGLYRGPMDRFKSVTDFLNKSRKSRRKKRKKLLAEMLIGGKNVALFTSEYIVESNVNYNSKMQRYMEEHQDYKTDNLDLAIRYFKEVCEKHG